MLGLARVAILMMVGLTVIYACLFFYLRSGARMRLEDDWIAEGRPENQEDWVDARIGKAVARIRVWLAICVYVIPVIVLTAFVWLTN